MNRFAFIILIAITSSLSTVRAQQAPPSGAAPNGRVSQDPLTPPNGKKAEDYGGNAKSVAEVLATVNGVKITIKDVDESIKETIIDLRQRVTEAWQRELDLQVNTKLLEREAKKRAMTSAKLIDQEIISKVKEPTEDEARAFYDQRKSQIQGDFNAVKADLIDYLRTQRQQEVAKRLADGLRAAAEVKILVETVTPPEKESDRAQVLATVNGEQITLGALEANLKAFTFNVQEDVYRLRKKELDLKINNVLLEQEAQKQKVTVRALLETEVASKVKKPTEIEVRAFYDQNKDKIKGEYEIAKPKILEYLQQREDRNVQLAFAAQLRRAAAIQLFLTAPEPPVYTIATDDQPSKGKPDAAVTIVQFTDYECPTCAKTQLIIEQLLKEYPDAVRLVIRDFPLKQHLNAFKAAVAAEAARDQGKYWEYIDLLFQNQSALAVHDLKEYASQLGLDRKKFDAALDSDTFADRLQRDLQEGMRMGINSTPTVFVNGRRVMEKTRESLEAAIKSALKNAARK